MPRPMPLVEPVISETLPFSACATDTEDIIAAIVMANALYRCPAEPYKVNLYTQS